MTVKLRVVTNSEQKTFRRCVREHHLTYRLGYRSTEDAEALRFGTMAHVGLEAWWLGHGIDAAVAAAVVGAVDEYEAAKVRVLLRGYDARWGGESHDVVAVEREFRAPLVNPASGRASQTFVLGGKMDVLLRSKFVEHKTTSQDIGVGSVYWQKLQIDSQVSTYYAGAKSCGVEPQACIYDVIRKPGIRPASIAVTDADGVKVVIGANGERVRTKDGKKWRETGDTAQGYVLQTRPETADEYEARLVDEVAANPDKYFQRGEVVRLEAEEREAAFDTWQTTRAMRNAELSGSYPRNADACERFGRLCSFFGVCTGSESLDDAAKFERLENVHQELSAESSAAE